MFNDPTTNAMAVFLNNIGIETIEGKIEEETVLPGIQIDHGKLVIDESKLLYPGDILHEAGHLAVKPKQERESAHINCGADPAEEMMALAWSYAALVHINIPPDVVFHEFGYKGQARQLIDNFQSDFCVGLPMLQWVGMTADKQNAPLRGVEPFPKMIKWLRE